VNLLAKRQKVSCEQTVNRELKEADEATTT